MSINKIYQDTKIMNEVLFWQNQYISDDVYITPRAKNKLTTNWYEKTSNFPDYEKPVW